MDVEDFLGYAMVISLVVIPAPGLTARFALKPIVDALLFHRTLAAPSARQLPER